MRKRGWRGLTGDIVSPGSSSRQWGFLSLSGATVRECCTDWNQGLPDKGLAAMTTVFRLRSLRSSLEWMAGVAWSWCIQTLMGSFVAERQSLGLPVWPVVFREQISAGIGLVLPSAGTIAHQYARPKPNHGGNQPSYQQPE